MSRPILILGETDFTEDVLSIAPSNNDLDADGSGRDIHSGEMFRTKVADKDALEIAMMRMSAATAAALTQALDGNFLSVTYLKPGTNTQVTKTMYCSSIKYGQQIYDKSRDDTFYAGMSFQLTEK